MEIYKSNGKNCKFYKKIDYIKLLLVIIVSLLIFSLFFYYIGKEQELCKSICTALIITVLISMGSIMSDLVDNRSRIFIINKNEIGFIEIHSEKVGGDFLKESEFNEILSKYDIEEIYKDNNKFEGIDKGIINKVLKIKKKYNKTIVKANIGLKEWKSSSFLTISKVYLIDKNCTKRIVIPNDYDKYDELIKKMRKMI